MKVGLDFDLLCEVTFVETKEHYFKPSQAGYYLINGELVYLRDDEDFLPLVIPSFPKQDNL